MANKYKLCFTFFIASLLLFSIYRIIFFINTDIFTFKSTSFRIIALSFGLLSDLLVSGIFTSIFLFLRFLNTKNRAVLCEKIILFSVFIFLAILCIINQKIVSTLYMSLNYTLIKMYLSQGFSLFNFITFLSYKELSLLSAFCLLYFVIVKINTDKFRLFLIYITLLMYACFIIIGASGFLVKKTEYPNKLFDDMFMNPLISIAISFKNQFNPYNFASFTFASKETPVISLPNIRFSNSGNWNIVIFVLESVGTNYLFDEINYPLPMPFLKSLATKSLVASNNYSGGNISALGEFSMVSGLYPNPYPIHFEMQENLHIPSIVNWLEKNTDSFLVSPSNNLYMATINKTFHSYITAAIINRKEPLIFNMFLNENTGFNYFLNRLNRAKTPYIGIYLSGATHFPYPDYKNNKHIMRDIRNPLHRYLNNLTLLDKEIKKTYELLRKKKQLEHTIFVIVGDHGEIFGQHNGYWIHGRSLFQEEIKVPLIIYAPTLFAPNVISYPTSSVDIVPTILAALSSTYPNQLQGKSLLDKRDNRPYIYVYGDEDDLASIDRNNMKMIISFSGNSCVSYNLNNDPHELHPLPCNDNNQKTAILKFRHLQPKFLGAYRQR